MSSSRGRNSPSEAAPGGEVGGALCGVRGDVFDIQRYAVHDGPGIRTVVFMKGCPLSCLWCQNPEGRNRGPELFFHASRCARCGRCANACPEGAVSMTPAGTPSTDRSLCARCGRCAQACRSEARRLAGRSVTAEEVLREAEADAVFYRRGGGGVTLSGGEPLVQPDFSAAVLALCRGSGIHTAVETCGYADVDALEAVVGLADLILYDLKHMDPEAHRSATGAGNERILENARRVSGMGKPMVIRFPLIPGVNDSPENARATAAFAAGLPGVIKIEILPYHRLGASKYEALGSDYPLAGTPPPSAASLNRILDIMKDCGVECSLEGFVEGKSD